MATKKYRIPYFERNTTSKYTSDNLYITSAYNIYSNQNLRPSRWVAVLENEIDSAKEGDSMSYLISASDFASIQTTCPGSLLDPSAISCDSLAPGGSAGRFGTWPVHVEMASISGLSFTRCFWVARHLPDASCNRDKIKKICLKENLNVLLLYYY